MGVGLKLRSVTDEIGSPDFFHAFFSTVHHHLEDGEWGCAFPAIMKELYAGELEEDRAAIALEELNTIATRLKELPPDRVVWDIENLDAKPPWGDNISSDITDLSNYFVTSTGRDLIETMREALELMVDRGGKLTVVQI